MGSPQVEVSGVAGRAGLPQGPGLAPRGDAQEEKTVFFGDETFHARQELVPLVGREKAFVDGFLAAGGVVAA